ncbi:CLDN23 [Vulpes lagopus]|uniref:claudin-23 n=1 Tax=Vulpes lagopus TaxID=494514 RepID=UPI001BCA33B2|nr:claudin-23 [Vulpes lagopus]
MRTPAVMTLGLVLAPCGLLLNLTATLTPGWRLVKGFLDQPVDVELYQGLWDLCREQSSRERQCGQPDRWGYLEAAPVRAARALMPSSLAAAALGLLLAALGVRCWREEPRFALAGLAGVGLAAAGLLGLAPVSWYTHRLADRAVLPADASPATVHVGYSLVLGYLGSCLLLLGGSSLALSLAPACAALRRRRRKQPPGAARRGSLSTVQVDWPAPAVEPRGPGPHPPGRAAAGFPLPRPPPAAPAAARPPCDSDL